MHYNVLLRNQFMCNLKLRCNIQLQHNPTMRCNVILRFHFTCNLDQRCNIKLWSNLAQCSKVILRFQFMRILELGHDIQLRRNSTMYRNVVSGFSSCTSHCCGGTLSCGAIPQRATSSELSCILARFSSNFRPIVFYFSSLVFLAVILLFSYVSLLPSSFIL